MRVVMDKNGERVDAPLRKRIIKQCLKCGKRFAAEEKDNYCLGCKPIKKE